MRLIYAIGWAALADLALSVAPNGLGVLQTAARVLRDARATRTLKRGLPWDLGVCEPRCIEGDGLWDDCFITVNFTKCLEHCYRYNDIADCFHCNQEELRKDYRVYEYQLGEVCVKFLRNPTGDLSWFGGDATNAFPAASTATSRTEATGPPPKTITAGKAL
ncbi:hypothetical protein CspeluHIS016_0402660 [Cutaneotrichosporon spelunceum]|uniref:Extracellular membrane protein CFEM domain-containing protein n=1 Tax=Cutaneotrichosporon spelunceum TaxID=1672016 RepID=A0AAD3TW16_9TREE|nr:hypothetical protein CspeluHIS016_0402660 [Cutaneotrichosporon spelunceum]